MSGTVVSNFVDFGSPLTAAQLNSSFALATAAASLASTSSSAPGAAFVGYGGRTLAARFGDAINLLDGFGADPTGHADNSAALAAALAAARSAGKALYVPAGIYGYTSATALQQGDVIYGDGARTQFLCLNAPSSTGSATLFNTTGTAPASAPNSGLPIILHGFRITGSAPTSGAFTTSSTMNSPAVVLNYFFQVFIEDLYVELTTGAGLNLAFNNEVSVQRSRFRYTSFDAIIASGSLNVDASNNKFFGCRNGTVSVHSNSNRSWGMARNIVANNNQCFASTGISMQGANNTTIIGNQMEFAGAIGIDVSYNATTSGHEGQNAPLALVIANNVITNVMNEQEWTGNNKITYIKVGSVPQQAGSSASVPGSPWLVLPAGWLATNSYALGATVVDPNNNVQKVTTAGTSAATAPTWNTTTGGTTTDGTVTWTNQGANVAAGKINSVAWAASTVKALGVQIVDSNGNIQQAGPSGWIPSTTYAANSLVSDINGNVQQVTAGGGGKSGSVVPVWNATVGGTTTDGALTWTNQGPAKTGATAPAWNTTQGGTTTDGTVVWTNIAPNVANPVSSPYPFWRNMLTGATDTTTPIPPGQGIIIEGNICARTVDATLGTFDQLGLGGLFTQTGWIPKQPLDTATILGATGININVPNGTTGAMAQIRHIKISSNFVQGMATAIQIGQGAQVLGCEIRENRLVDFAIRGIQLNTFATSLFSIYGRISITDNEFDGDPYFLSSGRGANGTWNSGSAFPRGLLCAGSPGVIIERNHFRNISEWIDGSLPTGALVRENLAFCNPIAMGYNAANTGLGTVPAVSDGFKHVIEGGNPSSASFGQISSVPSDVATAQPSAGTWVAGHYVRNTAPALAVTATWQASTSYSVGNLIVDTNGNIQRVKTAGTSGTTQPTWLGAIGLTEIDNTVTWINQGSNKCVLGWLRLTTGSGNVAGTDWLAVYGTSS